MFGFYLSRFLLPWNRIRMMRLDPGDFAVNSSKKLCHANVYVAEGCELTRRIVGTPLCKP